MNSIIEYFDINKRSSNKVIYPAKVKIATSSIDTQSTPIPELVNGNNVTETKESNSIWQQLIMYLGIFIGVLLSSYVFAMKDGKGITEIKFGWVSILISLVISLILIPKVYEKLEVKPKTPFIVKLGLFVQQGVFWQVLLGAIGKTI